MTITERGDWAFAWCWLLLLTVALPGNSRAAAAATATTYYVDSATGNDENPGTSEDGPWKSLDRVNSHTFAPGDRLLLKADTTYTGMLAPQGSGKDGSPIVLDMYGSGAKPRIDAQGKYDQALLLRNVEYWEVKNLELTNQGEERKPFRFGVRLVVDDFGTAHHLHLTNLHVHDVNSVLTDQRSPYGGVKVELRGGGIVWMTQGADQAKPSRFDGILIENCHLVQVDQDGIWGWAGHKDKGKWYLYDRNGGWYPNLNVVVRGNLLEDIGGTGIVPRNCHGCLVEGNTIRGACSRARAGETGLYVWSCDGTIVQFNEISDVQRIKGSRGGIVDRVAFDSDFNCRNTVIQYNYSHDNVAGFASVFSGWKAKWNLGNTGTVIRYNISQNDGYGLGHLFYHVQSRAKNVQIYNNTFFVGKSIKIKKVFSERLTGEYQVGNNLFFVEGQLTFDAAQVEHVVFENNALFGNITGPPANRRGLTVDPLLTAPGTARDGRESLLGYRLRPGSPCIRAGKLIPDNGGRDFWGNPVSPSLPPDIGAHSFSGTLKGVQ